MIENEFCISLIKSVTEVLLKHTKSQSEALKIIKIGVQFALNSHEKKEKESEGKNIS